MIGVLGIMISFLSVPPMSSFDAYLTWQDYDPWSVDRSLAGAVFIWNGRKLGRGKPADNELLRELKAMPIGSRVLVYPRYEEITPYPMQRLYPNPIYTPAFNRVLAERRLTIIFSPYDHLGRICPDAYDGVHLPPEAPPDRLPAASTGLMPSTATSSAPP